MSLSSLSADLNDTVYSGFHSAAGIQFDPPTLTFESSDAVLLIGAGACPRDSSGALPVHACYLEQARSGPRCVMPDRLRTSAIVPTPRMHMNVICFPLQLLGGPPDEQGSRVVAEITPTTIALDPYVVNSTVACVMFHGVFSADSYTMQYVAFTGTAPGEEPEPFTVLIGLPAQMAQLY